MSPHWVVILFGILMTYWYLQDDKLDTIAGKRVLVTGSSEGIGEHMAYHYARLGANVVVTARRLDRLNKVKDECTSLSPSPKQKHFAISADMAKLEDTKRVIQESIKKLGGLDILVLNHIVKNSLQAFAGTPEHLDVLHTIMDVDFRSYVHLASHALPELLANNGSIIVVNSMNGKIPFPFMAAYSAAKHALNGFFRSLKSQLAAEGQNVSVTSCTLGLIETRTAMEVMGQFADTKVKQFVIPASPNETALSVIIGGARRVDDVYFPYLGSTILVGLYNLFPSLSEYILSQITSLSAKI